MKVSVLMSVYSKEKSQYLLEALKSIWDDQTLRPEEIILVEDGILTKSLYNVIDDFEKKIGNRLKRIRLSKNLGLTAALNIGIKYCSCDYIARMDSDDISAPERFEKQVDFLNNHRDVYVLGGSIQEFSDKSENLMVRSYPTNREAAVKYIAKASPFAHATVMFRKVVFESGIKYSEKYKTSQDIDLWFQILNCNYEISNLRTITYYVRVNEEFYARRSTKKAINEFKIYWFGIKQLYGVSFKLSFPVIRLVFRLMPRTLVRQFYTGNFRKTLNK